MNVAARSSGGWIQTMLRSADMKSKMASLVTAASFEERALVATEEFLEQGGQPRDVYVANVAEDDVRRNANVDALAERGVELGEALNRLDSRSLWRWVLRTIQTVPYGDIVLDVTCIPRELLGMILYAVSLMRNRFARVVVVYVSVPEHGYATQNPELEESCQWLTQGVCDIRSIVGFPGEFSGEKEGHVIALAGHEEDRLVDVVEYMEPRKLSIGSGAPGSSTTLGADELSRHVETRFS